MFRPNDDEWCDIEVEAIIRATEKAVLIVYDGGEETWVPRSMIQDGELLETFVGNDVILVKEWFARKEGMI